MARRGCAALLGSSINDHIGEARVLQLTTDQRGIVIAVWRACQEAWRIVRKDFRERVRTSFANTFSSIRSRRKATYGRWPTHCVA